MVLGDAISDQKASPPQQFKALKQVTDFEIYSKAKEQSTRYHSYKTYFKRDEKHSSYAENTISYIQHGQVVVLKMSLFSSQQIS